MFSEENGRTPESVRLADIVRERWGKDAEGLAPAAGHPDERFLEEASGLARQHLTLADHLAAVKKPNGPLHRRVENMPTDPSLPPPPTDGKRPAGKKNWVGEAVLLGATRAIGLEAFTYLQERDGLWP